MDGTSTDILERKVFHIQSKLLESGPVNQVKKALSEAQLWLQPRHYFEIIEERSNDSICGYPACTNSIVRPSDVSSILKISYKEKRLYEIGRSKLFCCNSCLQKSAIFEASLSDTHPASREVATAFLLTVKENNIGANDTLQSDYFSNATVSAVKSDSSNALSYNQETRCISPPKFHNPQLTAGGAAILFSEETDKKILIPLIDRKHSSDISTTTETQLPLSPELLHLKENEQAVQQKLPGKKKVGFLNVKSLESSVGEKWVDTKDVKAPSPRTSTKKHFLQPFDYNDIIKIHAVSASSTIGGISEKPTSSPNPVVNADVTDSPISYLPVLNKSIVAPESKHEAAVKVADNLYSLEEDEEEGDETDEDSDGEESDEDGDSSVRVVEEVSLFMTMWTTLDDLFGDSISSICTPAMIISDCSPDNHSSVLLTNNDVIDKMIAIDSEESKITASLVTTSNPTGNLDRERSAEDDIIEERKPIDPTLLASRRSVAMFMERGFISAEASCGLSGYLTRESMTHYHVVKAQLLTSIGQSSSACPKLNSSEFSLLALLAIDAVVVNQRLLIGTVSDIDTAEVRWSDKLRTSTTQILRKRAGRREQQQQSRTLREGDLELLRNFFPRKLL